MRLDLDGLAAAQRDALMSEWREVVGRPPPKHSSKPVMVQILSHAYQVDTVGGYTKRLDRRLKSAAQNAAAPEPTAAMNEYWEVEAATNAAY